jgi:aldehyde dehydrogenase (NAD+)
MARLPKDGAARAARRRPAVAAGRRARRAARELTFDGAFRYAPARESAAHARLAARLGPFVGGRELLPRSGPHVAVTDPATGARLAAVAPAGPAVVAAAVRAAARALVQWRALPGERRARCLLRAGELLLERARELAVLATLETGGPITATRELVALAARHFVHHAGWTDKLELAFPGHRPAPLGVAAVLLPAGAPLLAAARHLAPALAAGATAVLKPAARAPLAALRLAALLHEAGLPRGAVNVLPGDDTVRDALVRHPGIAAVAATGSAAADREVRRALGARTVPCVLEPNGITVHVVCEDAAPDQAVDAIVRGALDPAHGGGARLLVQESVHDVLVRKLAARLQRVRVGDPLDRNTDLGAMPSARDAARLRALVAAAGRAGCTVFRPRCTLPAKGSWFAPALCTGVALAHELARAELRGPVLAVLTFRTPAEAVAKANTILAGTASVWTDKRARSLWLAERLRAAVVWNDTCNRLDPGAPSGAFGPAGAGRTGGRAGLRAYVRLAGGLEPG